MCTVIGLAAIHFTYGVLYLFQSVIFCLETCLSTDILPLMIPTHFIFCWQKHDSFHSGKTQPFLSVWFICSHVQYCEGVADLCYRNTVQQKWNEIKDFYFFKIGYTEQWTATYWARSTLWQVTALCLWTNWSLMYTFYRFFFAFYFFFTFKQFCCNCSGDVDGHACFCYCR